MCIGKIASMTLSALVYGDLSPDSSPRSHTRRSFRRTHRTSLNLSDRRDRDRIGPLSDRYIRVGHRSSERDYVSAAARPTDDERSLDAHLLRCNDCIHDLSLSAVNPSKGVHFRDSSTRGRKREVWTSECQHAHDRGVHLRTRCDSTSSPS